MTQIQGQSGVFQDVNDDQEALVFASVQSELLKAAKAGEAWAFYSGEQNIDAGDTMLFVQNTSATKKLIITDIYINPSDVACQWTVAIGNASTTASGTAATSTNLNADFLGTSPDANVLYDETAVADANSIATVTTSDNDSTAGLTAVCLPVPLVLGKDRYLQVNQETASTSGSVTAIGYYV